MAVLVTGGAGYIGSAFVEQLVAAGEKVVVLDGDGSVLMNLGGLATLLLYGGYLFTTSFSWELFLTGGGVVISWLAIQKGERVTSCWGPSSLPRPFSRRGLPIRKVPPGIGTMGIFSLLCSINSA